MNTWRLPPAPIKWQFDDRTKRCPLCHHRASIIIKLLAVLLLWRAHQPFKVNSWKTTLRRINPSSSHGIIKWFPITTLLSNLGIRVWWISIQTFLRRREFPIFWYHPLFVMVSWSFPSTSASLGLCSSTSQDCVEEMKRKKQENFREYEIRRRASELGKIVLPARWC